MNNEIISTRMELDMASQQVISQMLISRSDFTKLLEDSMSKTIDEFLDETNMVEYMKRILRTRLDSFERQFDEAYRKTISVMFEENIQRKLYSIVDKMVDEHIEKMNNN